MYGYRYVGELESCVKSHVRARCGDRAAQMMPMLVDMSAHLSATSAQPDITTITIITPPPKLL